MSENKSKGTTKKVRRAILPVIDKTFQLKVTLFALLFVLLSHMLLVAIHFSNLKDTATAALGKSGMEMETFMHDRRVIWARDLALGFTAVTILVGLGVFYLTQKVSGPLYAMSRTLDEVARGNLKARVHLRRADEFMWFADKLNEALNSVEKRASK